MKRNDSQYFSGSFLTRLPLNRLLAGGMAFVLCTGLGVGTAAAAAFAREQPAANGEAILEMAAPTETPLPTATSTPDPTATPRPDVEVLLNVTVVQQDIGVEAYTMEVPEDAEIENATPEKRPLLGVPLTVIITDKDGKEQTFALDKSSGTALAEDVKPGEYTVTMQAKLGYHMPEPQTVTVKEKVVYVANVSAVKDKIVQAAQVVESQEDSNYGGGSVISNEIKDTVRYAESAKTQTGTKVTYTATVKNGHLVRDGAESPYRPVYDESGALVGAKRDSTHGKPIPLSLRLVSVEGGEPTPAPAAEPEPTATPEATETPEPTATPEMTATPEPTASAEPTPEATNTPEVTATPEPTASAEPTPSPTPTPDPYASIPAELKAEELANYGFAVEKREEPMYEYTGWQVIGTSTYYYDPDSHQPVTGSQVIRGDVYNFSASGALNQTSRGVDVSKFQGNIDWKAVASDGIRFAIIRCGYRGYGSGALVEDSTFRANIRGATAAGLQVGVYFYSQAITEEEAVEEASMVISLCKGYGLPCGVYYDTEKVAGDTGRADNISAAQRTACAVAFCETIRNAGYTAGVYSYAGWFYNSLNFANLSKYRIWIAQYRDTLSFSYHYNIWQYSSTGNVKGIPKPVDMNLG